VRPLLALLALAAALALAAPAGAQEDFGPLGPVQETPAPGDPEPVTEDDGFGGLEAALVLGAALVLIAAIASYILRDARRRAPAEARARRAGAGAEEEEPGIPAARARERERRKRQARAKGRAARSARKQNR